MRTTMNVSGGATLDVAWERYVRPVLWATWAPHITGVSLSANGTGRGRPAAPRDRIAAGTTGRVTSIALVSVPFVVEHVDDAAHTWAWTVRAAGIRLHLTHTLTPTRGGVRTGLTIQGPALLVLPYLPLARLALRRLVADRADPPVS